MVTINVKWFDFDNKHDVNIIAFGNRLLFNAKTSYPHLRHISAIYRQYHSNLNVSDGIELLYAGSHVAVNFYVHGWCTLLDKNNFYFETIKIIMWLLRLIRYSICTARLVQKIFLCRKKKNKINGYQNVFIYRDTLINLAFTFEKLCNFDCYR